MECYYHPDREGADTCAICGKSICKECGLEIAGKIYCKECLEKIVGVGIESKASQPASEPARLNKQPADENIYQTQGVEKTPVAPEPTQEIKQISDDSPYNIKDNMEYDGGLETSYINENEPVQPKAEQPQVAQQPQITQNEPEYIYPDHSYEPEPTSARLELEDKYEKYLDDLYFDENEVPLGEQLAKDEEEFGSLTRKPYTPREEPPLTQKREMSKPPKNETPEEMEARIRAEILGEKEDGKKIKDKNIHNLNYQEEKESMGAVDILLTIILILVILVVIYYLIYIFTLTTYYPTFMDAVYGLTNPQNVINNILSPAQ
jgi:hypothetical protein